jgi:hypothetical protein
VVLLPDSEVFRSIQGTATCLPPARLELLELPRLLPLEPPTLLLELLGEVELLELGLVELGELLGEVELDEPEVSEELPVLLELPAGLVEAPVLLELLNDRIAKSIRPEVGLIIQSLIVPSWLPDVPVTWAPVSWLALIS